MRILLDTRIALWAVTGSRRLSRRARQIVLDAEEVHVSTATRREIAIKYALGQGAMPVSSALALQAFRDAGYAFLAIKPEHAVRVEDLPGQHGDPFDRMPVAQARFEPMTLVTDDAMVELYGAGVEMV